MSAQKSEDPDGVEDRAEAVNEVRLVGTAGRRRRSCGSCPAATPCGTCGWWSSEWCRRASEKPRQRVDSLECAVWSGRLKKQVERWEAGDVVEVSGAMRRRFFRAGGATASRVEVELSAGRIIRRAASG